MTSTSTEPMSVQTLVTAISKHRSPLAALKSELAVPMELYLTSMLKNLPSSRLRWRAARLIIPFNFSCYLRRVQTRKPIYPSHTIVLSSGFTEVSERSYQRMHQTLHSRSNYEPNSGSTSAFLIAINRQSPGTQHDKKTLQNDVL